MMRLFFSTIPRQHGTWFIFLTAYIMGHFVYSLPLNSSTILFISILFAIFAFNTSVIIIKGYRIGKRTLKFLPTYLRALYIVFKRYEAPPAVVKIGWSEVANSLIFVTLVILVFRVS